jgi:hypothetical protein
LGNCNGSEQIIFLEAVDLSHGHAKKLLLILPRELIKNFPSWCWAENSESSVLEVLGKNGGDLYFLWIVHAVAINSPEITKSPWLLLLPAN